MTLNFQVLGLFISWLFIMIYYSKEEVLKKEKNVFRGILIMNYIVELLYLCTAMAVNNQSGGIIYAKFYWISMIVLFGLITFYIYQVILHKKYQNQETIAEQKEKVIRNIILIVLGISILVVLVGMNPIIQGEFLCFKESIIVYLLLGYTIFNLGIILLNRKVLDKGKFSVLFILSLVELLSIGLQYYFEGVTILNSGMLLITMCLYLYLENSDKRKLEVLQLERDQAIYHSIDKQAFLKTLSHEIRIPLNTIDGFSQIIMDTDDLTEIKEDTKDIRLASKDLIDIINGMIDLSIIESGELQVIYENYNVYEMFDNITELIQSKMRDSKVQLEVELEKGIPEVLYGDSERISQIVLNLLKNSIKYTEEGKITLKASCVKSSSVCRLKIEVIDTGRGIQKEELVTLFDSHNDKKDYNLGLRVSKYLIELMNGKLEVESTYGKGSTFTITLDQKIISEVATKEEKKKKVIRPFKADDKRILIVDDNKLNLKVASKLLEPYQVQIVEANSGQECLDILDKDTNFDLILMDDLMPSLSGTETLDILKKIQRIDGFYIPVVVLTANAIAGMKEKYLNAGFEDYMAKPIEKEELDRILKKYLKK